MDSTHQPTFADETPANNADSLDGEVLGEEPRDDRLPGLNDFTDRTILNSEDPAVIMGGSETQDNLETRAWREIPEDIEVSEAGGFRIVDLDLSDTATPTSDGEKQLVGSARDVPEPSAEEAAIRVERG